MSWNSLDEDLHEAECLLNIKFPNELKNILIINGYNSLRVIGEITDDDIADIESFARDNLPDMIAKDDSDVTSNSSYNSNEHFSLDESTDMEDFSVEQTKIDSLNNEDSSEDSNEDEIESEKCYATYYDSQWYTGRLIDKVENEMETGDSRNCYYRLKFLHQNLQDFFLPKTQDVDMVLRSQIFYGPITMIGCETSLRISREDRANIEKKYRDFKKDL
ncbi:unnamed protein product [Phaedon cochleariae]|uniref:Uncharacterized protein n=1 Tax=Phaedon cochleariae TaxID=80249 RepID=A0A9N9SJ26_PHACE|nr:unnamed protein product [Phaedon cochleariae]